MLRLSFEILVELLKHDWILFLKSFFQTDFDSLSDLGVLNDFKLIRVLSPLVEVLHARHHDSTDFVSGGHLFALQDIEDANNSGVSISLSWATGGPVFVFVLKNVLEGKLLLIFFRDLRSWNWRRNLRVFWGRENNFLFLRLLMTRLWEFSDDPLVMSRIIAAQLYIWVDCFSVLQNGLMNLLGNIRVEL